MLKNVQHAFSYKGASIPIVRLNWSTVFCFEWDYNKSQTVPAFSVKDAIALGVEVVLISLTLKTDDESNDARNVEIYSRLCNEAREYGGHTTPNPFDSLLLAQKEIQEGCRGVVFGRNAIQRRDPIAYQRALCEVVKHSADPYEKLEKYNLK